MPMYEYRCEACGERFEHLQWRAADPDPRCGCGSERVERIPYSRVSVASSHAGVEPMGCGGGECQADTGCCGGGACDWN